MDNEIEDLEGRVQVLSARAAFNGAYSTIYRGSLDRKELVAVKVINPIRGTSLSTILRKLGRERSTWSKLRHPNILPLYGFASDHELFEPFGALISPWRERGDLGNYLEKQGSSISLYERLRLWAGIVAGVTYLHANNPVEVIVHGDLKPWNVLISDEGTPEICDFGLTRVILEEGLSSGVSTTTAHTGTYRYLAYELVLSETTVATPASDIYATGCIGLELIFGGIPYPECAGGMNLLHLIYNEMIAGKPPAACPGNLTPDLKPLWSFVSWCWARDPSTRPDARALSMSLQGVLPHFSETLESTPTPKEVHPPQQPPPLVIAPPPPVPPKPSVAIDKVDQPPQSSEDRPSSSGNISNHPPDANVSPTSQNPLIKFFKRLPRQDSSPVASRASNETLARTQSGSSTHGSADHSQSNSTAPSVSPIAILPSHTLARSPDHLHVELPLTPSPSSSLGRTRSSLAPDSPSSAVQRRTPNLIIREDTVVPGGRKSTSTNASSDYGHVIPSNSKLLELCLIKEGKKDVPFYQDGEPVAGCIVLKSLEQVEQIEVTLEGNLRVVYSRGSMRYKHIDVPLFKETKKLYPGTGDPVLRESHPFTFTFPEEYGAGKTPLPPTWSLAHPGIEAEVSYTIRATLKRRGRLSIGRDEAQGKLGYSPRIAPPLTEPLSPNRPTRPRLRVLELDRDIGPNVVLRARITLCVPQTYASASPIPYAVYFYSPNGTSIPVSIELDVTIVRIAKFLVHGEADERKEVVARGVNKASQLAGQPYPSNDSGAGTDLGGPFTIRGSCMVGSNSQETTWSVGNVAVVKYVMRFVVAPKQRTQNSSKLRDAIPPFEHVEAVTLTSDTSYALSPDVEDRLPAAPRLGHLPTRSGTATTDATQSVRDISRGTGRVGTLELPNTVASGKWADEFPWISGV